MLYREAILVREDEIVRENERAETEKEAVSSFRTLSRRSDETR